MHQCLCQQVVHTKDKLGNHPYQFAIKREPIVKRVCKVAPLVNPTRIYLQDGRNTISAVCPPPATAVVAADLVLRQLVLSLENSTHNVPVWSDSADTLT